MYLPTRSASSLVEALTWLWTEKPEWRHSMIFSTSFPWKEETMNEILGFTMSTEVNNPPDVLSTSVVSKRQDFTSLKN